MALNIDPLLSVCGLKTHFFTEQGIVRAVEDVNLSIQAGESLGLVGESGCGKTMTAMSILRLVPDPPGRTVSGTILFKGKDLLKLSEEQMRKVRGGQIAMIFQEPSSSMNPSFTIGNQIKEVIRFHQKISNHEVAQKAIDILNAVQIPDPMRILSQYPHELSGGMLQRVMIAMAISCEPSILICDEPTTALDVSTQAQIIKLLIELREKKGTCLLFITHDLGVLSWVCTSAAVMYAGSIVEYATIRDLLKNPKHPYTKALIGATPRLDTDLEHLSVIPGDVPSLIDPPVGCKFHKRCRISRGQCRERVPVLEEKKQGHQVACHFV